MNLPIKTYDDIKKYINMTFNEVHNFYECPHDMYSESGYYCLILKIKTSNVDMCKCNFVSNEP